MVARRRGSHEIRGGEVRLAIVEHLTGVPGEDPFELEID